MRESLRFVMELEVSLLLFRIDIVCFFAKIVVKRICVARTGRWPEPLSL